MTDRTDERTTHTCGGPVFGRLTAGCPRCEQLKQGAEPVRWNRRPRTEREQTGGYPTTTEIREHFAPGSPHSRGACGPVCTFGDY